MQTIDLQLEMLLDARQAGADRRGRKFPRRSPSSKQAFPRRAMAMSWMLLGLSILAALIIVIGTAGEKRGVPELWTHGLIALVIGQFAVAVGASIKVVEPVDSSEMQLPQRQGLPAEIGGSGVNRGLANPAKLPPIVSLASLIPPRREFAKGKIGERSFVEYSDGSIEVDTLLGRRRFPTLEMAQEFVGGVAARDSTDADETAMLAA